MSYKRETQLMSVASFATFTGSLIALIFWGAGFTFRGFLLLSIAIVLIFPLFWQAIRLRLDPLEPLVLSNIALGVMFVGRPLLQTIVNDLNHHGYFIGSTFNEALVVSLVGVTCLQLGYLVRPGVTLWARRLPAPPDMEPRRIAVAGWIYIWIGLLLFGAFLYQEGGISLLFVLLEGRQQSDHDLFLRTTGYLYNGLLTWGAAALLFFGIAVARRRRSYWLWFLAPTLLLIVFYGARGGRSALFPLIVAVPVFWYMWKNRRPSCRTLIIVFTIGVVLLGVLRETRMADNDSDFVTTMVSALRSPGSEALEILGGADAEMFDSLATELLIVPEQMSFMHGATIIDILIRAVPRPLWPTKPLESNDALVNALWPDHFAKSRAAPAFSLIGVLYADSGYITVVLGMSGLGWMLALSWRWIQYHRKSLVGLMVYAMGLPFVVILLRGTLPDTLARMLFLLIPVILLIVLKRLRVKKRSRRAPIAPNSKFVRQEK